MKHLEALPFYRHTRQTLVAAGLTALTLASCGSEPEPVTAPDSFTTTTAATTPEAPSTSTTLPPAPETTTTTVAPVTKFEVGVTHPTILNVETNLKLIGCNDIDTPDDYYDEKAGVAVATFQEFKNLASDMIPGPATRAALQKSVDAGEKNCGAPIAPAPKPRQTQPVSPSPTISGFERGYAGGGAGGGGGGNSDSTIDTNTQSPIISGFEGGYAGAGGGGGGSIAGNEAPQEESAIGRSGSW